MRVPHWAQIALLLIAGLGLSPFCQAKTSVESSAVPVPSNQTSRPQLPLLFEQNQGQSDSSVRFLARGPGYLVFLTDSEAVWKLRTADGQPRVLRMRLQGGQAAEVLGEQPSTVSGHYFDINRAEAAPTALIRFEQVRLKNVWPGVDLLYYDGGGVLEFDFELQPGADPSAVVWRLEGADAVKLDDEGALELRVAGEAVRFRPPVSYQRKSGKRVAIASRYRLLSEQRIGIELDAYDQQLALTVDPVFVYSTLLGGSLGEFASDIAIDSAGQAVVVGSTESSDFPLSNALDSTYDGDGDAFVAKFNADGSALLFSSFLGGAKLQAADQVELAPNGDIVVAGRNHLLDDDGDAFVLRLNGSANSLIYSQTFGSSYGDTAAGLAVDGSNNAYVFGHAGTSDFPSINPPQASCNGTSSYLRKVDASGNVVYSWCMGGGAGPDIARGMAIDLASRLHIVGMKANKAYAARLNNAATSFHYQTTFGGSHYDEATAVTTDGASNPYIVGTTSSNDFPVVNGIQPNNGGGTDAFFARLSSAGALEYSTYLGAAQTQRANDVALGPNNSAFLTGENYLDSPFGNANLFVLRLDRLANGTYSLGYSTTLKLDLYAQSESAAAIAVDAAGNAFVAGNAFSGFVTTEDAFQTSTAGERGDAFVFKLSPANPTLSMPDVQLSEGTGSSTHFSIRVELSAPSSETVTVDYTTVNGTALSGADYTAKSGTLTFYPGLRYAWIYLIANADSLVEADETYQVQLSNPNGVTIVDATAQITLQNDDVGGSLRLASGSYVVDEDAGTASVVVQRIGGAASGVTVQYSTANGSATAPADYTSSSGSLSFAANETSKTVTIPIVDDAIDEPNQTFVLSLSSPGGGASLGTPSSTTLTIQDNDPSPNISIGDAQVTEGTGGSKSIAFTVALSHASSSAISVDWATVNGTAVAPADYAAGSGTLTFSAGQTSRTITRSVVTDSIDEPDESFLIRLSNPVNAGIADAEAQGSIIDDDAAPSLSIDSGGCSVTEGDSGSTGCAFVLRLSSASGRTVSFNTATTGGTATAGVDFSAHSSTARSIAAGQTSLTVNVPVLGDTLDEADESFGLTVTGISNASPGSLSGQGTIIDNDAAPVLSIDNGGCSVTEGNSGSKNCTFVLRLSSASGKTVSFTTATGSGTALTGDDFSAHSVTPRSIAPGQSSLTVNVPVLGDTLDEEDESFGLFVTGVNNATPGSLNGQGNILDNDAAPVLSIIDGGCTATEGMSHEERKIDLDQCVFVMELSEASGKTVSFNSSTRDGTAIAGSDYTSHSSTTRSISPGQTMVAVSVPIIGDLEVENEEQFYLDITAVSNATPGSLSGLGTIVDDDSRPTLTVSGCSVSEGNDGSRQCGFVFQLSDLSADTVRFTTSTQEGSATHGIDYQAHASMDWEIPAGQTAVTVSVPVWGDRLYEPQEYFQLLVVDVSNANLLTSSAEGLIDDDDLPPDVSIDPCLVLEGDEGSAGCATRIRLSEVSGLPVVVNLATESVSANALNNGDFEWPNLAGSPMMFGPGQSIGGWRVVAGNVDLRENAPSAYAGAQAVDLNGTEPGLLTQSFSNPAGARLGLVYRANPDCPGQEQRMEVLLNGQRLALIATAAADWARTEMSTELPPGGATVALMSLSDGGCGLLVDDIQIVPGNTAIPQVDFLRFPPRRFEVPAGKTESEPFSLSVWGDQVQERDEQFGIRATDGSGFGVAQAGVATILNDDQGPRIFCAGFEDAECR
ncbi:Calx-beta domain-containing protein [Pseudomarimonas arenosa]|uniref:Calx-beta domain-containing protein n=1 Tax=Pseudomarimonas arenosa TaxID=2774145 RepID=A0AAW3ZIT7_9GAMM|nr:Calx-beta domain-containing protein [Pseudomarimonas arenosa]MBD8524602.1 hypothetical protein [Pseudomarimonas arenosa]